MAPTAFGSGARHGQNAGSAIIFLNGTGDYVQMRNKGNHRLWDSRSDYNRFAREFIYQLKLHEFRFRQKCPIRTGFT